MIEKFIERQEITGNRAREIRANLQKHSGTDSMFAGANLERILGKQLANAFQNDWNKNGAIYLESARNADHKRVSKDAAKGR